MKATELFCLAALALAAAACCPPAALAQANTPAEEQSFDYTPGAGEQTPKMAPPSAETTFTVKLDLPGLRGPAVEKLYAEGIAWLAGSEKPGQP